MAILRGFPPSNTISPSVRIAEKDLSFISPEQSFHRAGLVGFASKGPINIPTVIRSRRQLNTVFGYPHPESGDPYLIYAAEQYLLVASELYVVRVADTDNVSWERARTASVECASSGGAVKIVSEMSEPYNFDNDMYFRWRLNGVLASKTLVALSNANHPDPVVNNAGYSTAQLVEDLNLQLNPAVDGIRFFSATSQIVQEDSEMQETDSPTNDASFTLSGGDGSDKAIVAGSVKGRVLIGGVVVQTFGVDSSGDIFFKKVSDSTVRANGGELNLETGVLTLHYTNSLPAKPVGYTGTYNGVSVDYKYKKDFTSARLGVETTFSFGPDASLEIVSVGDSMCGPEGVTGLGVGMTPAQMTGSGYENSDGTKSYVYDFTKLSEYDLQVVVDGTDNVLVDNVVQVVDLSGFANDDSVTAQQIVDAVNLAISNGDVPGGFEAVRVDGDEVSMVGLKTLHSGRDARLLVKNESSVFVMLGFNKPLLDPADPSFTNSEGSNEGFYVTAMGGSPDGSSSDAAVAEYGIVNGDSNRLGEVSMTITADSPGIDGNGTQVVVKNNIREGNFTMEVYNNGVQVESWGNLSKDETSRYYVETFLTLVSDYIRVIDNSGNSSPPLDGVYNLSGGSDGIPSDPDDQDFLLIGNEVGYTGIYSLSEPEQIDIDLVAVPGHSSTGVVLALIGLCQNYRTDCMAIVDAPFGLTVKEIVNWQNGAHPLNTTKFDSDFAALYWPWVKIRDAFNNVDVWVPPSGSVMAVYARSDALAAPWFAPAGLNRGVVPGILDVFSRPTLEERDLMYGNRNAINPIVQYADFQDFVVWGQKTLQRRPTALDRVNVRRMMFVIEKRIRQASRSLLFEPHDETFRTKFIEIAESVLREVKIGRGLVDFIIKADDDLNTPDVIDRNEFRARIGVQPTKAVEFIFIEFSIHRTGSFEAGSDTF